MNIVCIMCIIGNCFEISLTFYDGPDSYDYVGKTWNKSENVRNVIEATKYLVLVCIYFAEIIKVLKQLFIHYINKRFNIQWEHL